MSSDGIRTSLIFPFKDPRWVMKLTIGSLLILASTVVPLVPLFFVAGYSLRIIQRIIHGDGQPVLPEWDDWEWLFKHGFKLSEAGLFYALPGLVLFTCRIHHGILPDPGYEPGPAGFQRTSNPYQRMPRRS